MKESVELRIGTGAGFVGTENVQTRQHVAHEYAGQIDAAVPQQPPPRMVFEVERGGDAAQRIGVEQQDSRLGQSGGGREIDRGRRLTDAAFLAGDEEFAH